MHRTAQPRKSGLGPRARTAKRTKWAFDDGKVASQAPGVYAAPVHLLLQPTVLVERPPAGPARGKWPASPWLIGTLGAVALVTALCYWLWRWRKSRKSSS